jgi:hypothetical protein
MNLEGIGLVAGGHRESLAVLAPSRPGPIAKGILSRREGVEGWNTLNP